MAQKPTLSGACLGVVISLVGPEVFFLAIENDMGRVRPAMQGANLWLQKTTHTRHCSQYLTPA
jgi:hypothetical protein